MNLMVAMIYYLLHGYIVRNHFVHCCEGISMVYKNKFSCTIKNPHEQICSENSSWCTKFGSFVHCYVILVTMYEICSYIVAISKVATSNKS